MRRLDLSGQQFGRLTALEIAPAVKLPHTSHSAWKCRCSCGATVVVSTVKLRNRHTRSCGCLAADVQRVMRLRHGHSSGRKVSREYQTWSGIKDRCTNANNRSWLDYGGRGIDVCERWLRDFANFLADMGPRPPGTTIDRVNVNGNYEPSNCRWATSEQQRNNLRRTIYVQLPDGTSVSLKQFARLQQVPYLHLYNRVVQGGMTPGEALNAIGTRRGELRFGGRLIKDIARARGINYYTLRAAYRRGESPLTFLPRSTVNARHP